jgi:hypothetical protein
MSLTNAYLVTTKNLEAFLNAVKTAKAPDKFDNKFLKKLDFTSSNDRLFIGVLKGLGFVDESGIPTKRYFVFLDQTQSGRILAEAVREAYEDLFAVNVNAQLLPVDDVKNKLKTLTMGQKSDNVLGLMANTFKALSDLADWQAPGGSVTRDDPVAAAPEPEGDGAGEDARLGDSQPRAGNLQLHYNIQIHLPESRDVAVFEAIFAALRKHLG